MGLPHGKRKGKELVCICCVCGQARDDIGSSGSWLSLRAYKIRYRLQNSCLLFTHTFCPNCFMRHMRMLGLDAVRTARI